MQQLEQYSDVVVVPECCLASLSHLFGPRWFHLLHLVGLHLGLHLLPVLAYGALLGSQPGGFLAGLPDDRDLADALLGQRLHGFTCMSRRHNVKYLPPVKLILQGAGISRVTNTLLVSSVRGAASGPFR